MAPWTSQQLYQLADMVNAVLNETLIDDLHGTISIPDHFGPRNPQARDVRREVALPVKPSSFAMNASLAEVVSQLHANGLHISGVARKTIMKIGENYMVRKLSFWCFSNSFVIP